MILTIDRPPKLKGKNQYKVHHMELHRRKVQWGELAIVGMGTPPKWVRSGRCLQGPRRRGFHMRWFGPTWGAPVNKTSTHIATPVLRRCSRCHKLIGPRSRGFRLPHYDSTPRVAYTYYHLSCFLDELGIAEFIPMLDDELDDEEATP